MYNDKMEKKVYLFWKQYKLAGQSFVIRCQFLVVSFQLDFHNGRLITHKDNGKLITQRDSLCC